MDRVATDILGPLPTTESGNRYILVIGELFSKWVEAYALPDHTAESVVSRMVQEFMSRFGAPLDLHADQGRNYESKLFSDVCKLLGIHKTRSPPYHPSSNGMIERFNATLLDMISMYVNDNQRDWDENLALLTAAYRCCAHPSTGFSPNKLMLSREVNLPIDLVLGLPPKSVDDNTPNEYVQELQKTMSEVFQLSRQHLQGSGQRQKRDYDTRITCHNYEPGDLVYTRDSTRKVG